MGEKKTAPWLCDENGNPLDEKQIELAMTDDANLIINAGPGSGKTRLLVAHYLDLLMRHGDWDVESVVAVTFTEKAAAEMKERISRVLLRARKEVPLPKWRDRIEEILEHLPEAPIGTIHSFCARLLRKFALNAGVDPSFRILDELEAQTLKIKICEQWLWNKLSDNSDPIALEAQKVVEHWDFNRAVNLLVNMLNLRLLIEHQVATGKNILCPIGGLEEPELALERCYKHVADAYDKEKASIKALDYDDLLLRTWKLLKEEEQVRHHLRRTYRRILVDELQDTDRVQVEILGLICGWEENEPTGVLFFGVGDSQQSIYGFRNADVGVFNELWNWAKNRHGWRRETLDKNYRSVPCLVELTNHAFERIFKLSEKPDEVEQKVRMPLQVMQAVRQQGDDLAPIEFAFFKVEGEVSKWQKLRLEADWIARRILELHERGIAYRDIALLLRELVNASAFEDALRRYGIPYHIITGYGFFETMEAQDLLTFLQVLSEPDNDVALAAWLRSPMVGVSDETLFSIFGSDSNAALWLRGIATEENFELPLTELEREKLRLAK
ncbi:MAG: UvrD-helicase domain-containing protein, partial [Armatimonadota bacterium]